MSLPGLPALGEAGLACPLLLGLLAGGPLGRLGLVTHDVAGRLGLFAHEVTGRLGPVTDHFR